MNSSFGRGSPAPAPLAASDFVCYNAAPSSIQQQRAGLENFRTSGRNCMTSRRTAILLIATGISALASAGAASALDYPTRPVRFIVGYPAGGATDILARLIGQRLSERLGQNFVIENKPGAGNNIGTEFVTNTEPDGYTVFLVNPFNFIRDIAPVASFTRVPNVMTVALGVPAKTVAEFIAWVKANPGKVNMAS